MKGIYASVTESHSGGKGISALGDDVQERRHTYTWNDNQAVAGHSCSSNRKDSIATAWADDGCTGNDDDNRSSCSSSSSESDPWVYKYSTGGEDALQNQHCYSSYSSRLYKSTEVRSLPCHLFVRDEDRGVYVTSLFLVVLL